MEEPDRLRAIAATLAVVRAQGLAADAAVLLSNSNKIILLIRPSDVVARVAPAGQMDGGFELELAGRLSTAGRPVVAPDPRVEPVVHDADGFAMTLWSYAQPSAAASSPQDYARALHDLHRGLREIDLDAPQAVDRVDEARGLVADPVRSPALRDDDRELLITTLDDLRAVLLDAGVTDQLLHGEPHPGNLIATADGPVFVDLETCCRGPVEFDLAHAPAEVASHYSDSDPELLRHCRMLVLAMITAWRWDRDDQFPNGVELGRLWAGQLRAARQGSDDLVPRTLPGRSAPTLPPGAAAQAG